MKFCGNCGARCDDDARVCGECGHRLDEIEADARPEPAPEIAPRERTQRPAKVAKTGKGLGTWKWLIYNPLIVVLGILLIITGALANVHVRVNIPFVPDTEFVPDSVNRDDYGNITGTLERNYITVNQSCWQLIEALPYMFLNQESEADMIKLSNDSSYIALATEINAIVESVCTYDANFMFMGKLSDSSRKELGDRLSDYNVFKYIAPMLGGSMNGSGEMFITSYLSVLTYLVMCAMFIVAGVAFSCIAVYRMIKRSEVPPGKALTMPLVFELIALYLLKALGHGPSAMLVALIVVNIVFAAGVATVARICAGKTQPMRKTIHYAVTAATSILAACFLCASGFVRLPDFSTESVSGYMSSGSIGYLNNYTLEIALMVPMSYSFGNAFSPIGFGFALAIFSRSIGYLTGHPGKKKSQVSKTVAALIMAVIISAAKIVLGNLVPQLNTFLSPTYMLDVAAAIAFAVQLVFIIAYPAEKRNGGEAAGR